MNYSYLQFKISSNALNNLYQAVSNIIDLKTELRPGVRSVTALVHINEKVIEVLRGDGHSLCRITANLTYCDVSNDLNTSLFYFGLSIDYLKSVVAKLKETKDKAVEFTIDLNKDSIVAKGDNVTLTGTLADNNLMQMVGLERINSILSIAVNVKPVRINISELIDLLSKCQKYRRAKNPSKSLVLISYSSPQYAIDKPARLKLTNVDCAKGSEYYNVGTDTFNYCDSFYPEDWVIVLPLKAIVKLLKILRNYKQLNKQSDLVYIYAKDSWGLADFRADYINLLESIIISSQKRTEIDLGVWDSTNECNTVFDTCFMGSNEGDDVLKLTSNYFII